jgi:hypothetical protein
VCSTKRTAEVIPERLAVAEERKEQQWFVGSDFRRRKGSPLTVVILKMTMMIIGKIYDTYTCILL